MRTTLTLCSGAALAPLLFSSCGPAEAAAHPANVVFVCLDTVRADHLGCYGYAARPTTPAMDELAARSTVFLDTSATACWTKPSVPSFMTGLYPAQTGVFDGSSRDEGGATSDVLPASATTIAEVFQEAGYRTGAFVRNAQIREGQGLEQGFEVYEDEAGDAREIRWRALDWLDQGRAAGDARPFLLYAHFLDAHWPYPIPDEYATRFADEAALSPFRADDWKAVRDRINDGKTTLSEEELDALVALYDGALRYLDDQLAALFAGLELRGLADNTIVCIVSDHGEDFLEHGRIGHGHGLYETLLRVPWILHVPGRAPSVRAEPVSLVDLFPTLVASAGLRAPAAVEGVDRLSFEAVDRPCFAEHKGSRRYEQTARLAELKLERRFEHARATGPSVDARPGLPAPGERLAVDLELGADGELRATRVKRRDAEPGEPSELKGQIEEIDGDVLLVAGTVVELLPGYERYGETQAADGAEVRLAVGLPVKAKLVELDGGLGCKKLKLYPPDDAVGMELRGALDSIEPTPEGATLVIDSVSVRVDEATRLDLGDPRPERFSRVDVLAVLGLAREERASEGFEIATTWRSLERDPLELTEASETRPALEAWADALGVRLAERAIWVEGDRSSLSAEELDDLRAIGYAD